mmetsp:Transcript_41856/g.99286  ORF Transcript_41856/g.99286 Transcript_41856/m.99286 type:complete len:223 (+) Transcript_41856:98-766(+)
MDAVAHGPCPSLLLPARDRESLEPPALQAALQVLDVPEPCLEELVAALQGPRLAAERPLRVLVNLGLAGGLPCGRQRPTDGAEDDELLVLRELPEGVVGKLRVPLCRLHGETRHDETLGEIKWGVPADLPEEGHVDRALSVLLRKARGVPHVDEDGTARLSLPRRLLRRRAFELLLHQKRVHQRPDKIFGARLWLHYCSEVCILIFYPSKVGSVPFQSLCNP